MKNNSDIEFKFENNWIYHGIDWAYGIFHDFFESSPCDYNNLPPTGRIPQLLHGFFCSDSFWGRFWRLSIFLLIFFHFIPLLLAIRQGVGFTSNEVILPFVKDLTEYGFSFGVMVLVMSRKRFSIVQKDVLKHFIEGGVVNKDSSEIKNKLNTLNDKRLKLQTVILAASFIFSMFLLLTLLQDNLRSWHSYSESSNILHRVYGIAEFPTWCGFYVCCLVWPSCLYLILNGAVDGLYWLYFIHWLTHTQINEKLRINALHSDHCGGLHFFKYSVLAWSALIIAVGIVVVMDTLNYTQFLGAPITRWDIMMKLAAWIVLAMVIFLGPMTCLTWKLYDAKRDAEDRVLKLGHISSNTQPITLWDKLNEAQPDPESGFASAQDDVKNLTNVNQLFLHVTTMRVWPLDLKSILQMLGTVAGPLSLLLAVPKFYELLAYLGIFKK